MFLGTLHPRPHVPRTPLHPGAQVCAHVCARGLPRHREKRESGNSRSFSGGSDPRPSKHRWPMSGNLLCALHHSAPVFGEVNRGGQVANTRSLHQPAVRPRSGPVRVPRGRPHYGTIRLTSGHCLFVFVRAPFSKQCSGAMMRCCSITMLQTNNHRQAGPSHSRALSVEDSVTCPSFWTLLEYLLNKCNVFIPSNYSRACEQIASLLAAVPSWG